MSRNDVFLRSVLGMICAGHIVTGVSLLAGRRGARVAARLYGATFEPSPQFAYIIQPAGAYVLSMAFLQALAMRNPRRYKGAIDATLIVFAIRQFQRITRRRDIYESFGITPARHWTLTIYFQVLAVLLLVARIRMEREQTGTSG